MWILSITCFIVAKIYFPDPNADPDTDPRNHANRSSQLGSTTGGISEDMVRKMIATERLRASYKDLITKVSSGSQHLLFAFFFSRDVTLSVENVFIQ